MSACVTFFEAALDMLWSIINVGMALVAALLYQAPEHTPAHVASPIVALVSFAPAADVPAMIVKLRDRDPRERVRAACELRELGSDGRDAITALVERLSDNSPVDHWSADRDASTGQRTSSGRRRPGRKQRQHLSPSAPRRCHRSPRLLDLRSGWRDEMPSGPSGCDTIDEVCRRRWSP